MLKFHILYNEPECEERKCERKCESSVRNEIRTQNVEQLNLRRIRHTPFLLRYLIAQKNLIQVTPQKEED